MVRFMLIFANPLLYAGVRRPRRARKKPAPAITPAVPRDWRQECSTVHLDIPESAGLERSPFPDKNDMGTGCDSSGS